MNINNLSEHQPAIMLPKRLIIFHTNPVAWLEVHRTWKQACDHDKIGKPDTTIIITITTFIIQNIFYCLNDKKCIKLTKKCKTIAIPLL